MIAEYWKNALKKEFQNVKKYLTTERKLQRKKKHFLKEVKTRRKKCHHGMDKLQEIAMLTKKKKNRIDLAIKRYINLYL